MLAELLAAAALLASTLKFNGSLIMQLQGDGPVRLLVVECTEALDLRATAQWDEHRTVALGDQALARRPRRRPRAGAARDDARSQGCRHSSTRASSTLESGSVATLIEHYLATSEQLASRLALAVDGAAVAGLIVQRLPGATDADDATWHRVRARFGDASTPTLVTGSAEERLQAWFPHDDLRLFAARPARSRCSCSPERVAKALCIAGAAEVESILDERGEVEVTCEFCNRRYTFAPEAARALFAPTGGTRH